LILLAIDTSANLCAAALYDCDSHSVIAEKSEDIGRGHAERLMGLLAELLDEAGLAYRDLNQIAVTSGPGSFTGIRVGLATARGLALGLGLKVIGINVLEAIAFQHNSAPNDTPIVVALDAKRREVFLQIFSPSSEQLSKPLAVPIEQIGKIIPKQPIRIAGSASNVVAEQISRLANPPEIEICSNQNTASIADIANLAARLKPDANRPVPLYLRSADAKPQNNFALKRAAS